MTSHPLDLSSMLRQLVARRGRPFELVLHLGAGDDAIEIHASTMPKRLVLVEGDAEVASELRARLHGADLAAEVHASVVTPAGGPAQWHRYNLRALTGPRDALAWRDRYPRLQELGVSPVTSVGVAALIGSLVPAASASDLHLAADRLLLVELPGQEQDIVGALDEGMLRRFGTVIVLRCPDRAAIGNAGDPVAQRLAAAGFGRQSGTDSPAAALVHELYRIDEQRERQRRAAEERDAARAQSAASARELAQPRRPADEAAQRKTAAEVRPGQLESEAVDLKRRLDASQAQLNAVDPASLKAELDALAKTLDEERKTSRARGQRIERLEAELAEAQFRAELLQQELLKAEGQLEVVKDLLLANPTL